MKRLLGLLCQTPVEVWYVVGLMFCVYAILVWKFAALYYGRAFGKAVEEIVRQYREILKERGL